MKWCVTGPWQCLWQLSIINQSPTGQHLAIEHVEAEGHILPYGYSPFLEGTTAWPSRSSLPSQCPRLGLLALRSQEEREAGFLPTAAGCVVPLVSVALSSCPPGQAQGKRASPTPTWQLPGLHSFCFPNPDLARSCCTFFRHSSGLTGRLLPAGSPRQTPS